jgi:arylsulfatase A-like enzyme
MHLVPIHYELTALAIRGMDVFTPLFWISVHKKSVRLSHAYSPVASCIPARASLMTGMDANHTKVKGMGSGNNLLTSHWEHTLPGELAQVGYHNFAVGHLHFHP